MKLKVILDQWFKAKPLSNTNRINETAILPSQERYSGYSEEDLWVFEKFKNIEVVAEKDFIKNYLGMKMRPENLPKACHHLAGRVEGFPVPANWHAEAIEHIGLLKSVHAANGNYRIMELGAGGAPWLISGALAAKHLGITDIRMLGVEVDETHFVYLLQHLADNGFNPEEHYLFHAAVGSEKGKNFVPVVIDSANQWGGRPMLGREESEVTYMTYVLGVKKPDFKEIEVIAFSDLLTIEPHWDLVHMDIQGWELSICQSAVNELNERVSRVVVCTHSRKIDGDIMDFFHRNGWRLEHEKPTRFKYIYHIENLENMTIVDGTQVWCNPGLLKKRDTIS